MKRKNDGELLGKVSKKARVETPETKHPDSHSKTSDQLTPAEQLSVPISDLAFLKPKNSDSKFKKVRDYVSTHGFGTPTPRLTRTLSADVFREHYYDKNTLMDFCREVGISTVGLKNDINDRIDLFLRTGKISKIAPAPKSGVPDSVSGLRLDKQVVNYKSDPVTRAFFQRHIPGFEGFSAYIQKWLKERLANGEVFTYAEVIEEHKQFLKGKSKSKAAGEAGKVAHNSCEFNQFYIDYSHDTERKPHTAKEAWNLVRDSAGDKTYLRYKEQIKQIMKQLEMEEGIEKKEEKEKKKDEKSDEEVVVAEDVFSFKF